MRFMLDTSGKMMDICFVLARSSLTYFVFQFFFIMKLETSKGKHLQAKVLCKM